MAMGGYGKERGCVFAIGKLVRLPYCWRGRRGEEGVGSKGRGGGGRGGRRRRRRRKGERIQPYPSTNICQ